MKPAISCYRYGTGREKGEGLRIGVTRHVPRGIKREDWQKKGYFDLWMPLLAPSAGLVAKYTQHKLPFEIFARRYQAEMKNRESGQVIELLAAVALFQPLSLGCFCQDEARCHRRLLMKLVLTESKEQAKHLSKLKVTGKECESLRYASPVCFAQEDA